MKTIPLSTAAILALSVACNSTPSASTPPASTPSDTVRVPVEEHPTAEADNLPPPVAPTDTGEPAAEPKNPIAGGFGCGPFDPVKSQDACKTAADCAPSSHCHAPSCIAAAKAPPKPADLQCTMMLVCKTMDVGRCDCVDGVCALVTR